MTSAPNHSVYGAALWYMNENTQVKGHIIVICVINHLHKNGNYNHICEHIQVKNLINVTVAMNHSDGRKVYDDMCEHIVAEALSVQHM